MEIKDYLRVLGKRAWLLVMIPAVAGVVAGLIAVGQPQAFRTTATLQLPRDETTTPAQVAQLVADFQAAADNPNVQRQVSEETGVPVKRIQRVRITQVGDSSQLTMSFQDRRKEATDAKAVINGLAAGSLDYLQTPELRNGQQAVDTANAQIEQAQTEIDEATDERNALFEQVQTNRPESEVQDLRDDKRQFLRDLAREQAAGNTAGAETYRGLIEEADLRIYALEQVVPQVMDLDQRIENAEQALTTAQEELSSAQEQVSNASFEPDLTFSAEGQSVVRKTRVVKTAAAAVVAGFPIAIGVVLLLDAFQKRRANRPVRPDHGDELAAAAEDERELEPAPGAPVSPSPALIGASAGPAGLPAAAPYDPVDELDLEEDVDEYEDELDDETDETDETDVEFESDDDDEVEAVIVDELDVEDGVEAELDDETDEEEVDEADVLDELEDDELDDAEAELDEAELDEAELDEAELDDAELDEAELDEAELDELALTDLDEADLGDDLDEDLEDDVAATVASRRRLYEADIDDDLSVDGGPAEHHGAEQSRPQHNGQGRVWARVPAADADFDGDDEAGADR